MILHNDQIIGRIRGALRFGTGPNGGVVPERFMPAQLENASPSFELRSRASAGVVIDCPKGAAAFTLKYCCSPGSSRDYYCLDTVVDGDVYAHTEGLLTESPMGEWRVELPQDFKSAGIYLPCIARCEIISLEFEGIDRLEPLDKKPVILFLGDSITQGYISHFPFLTYTALTADRLGCDMINQGIGGEVFRPEMLEEAPVWRPDMIVVAYGTNDWRHTAREVLAENSNAFIEKLLRVWPGTPIVMLSPIWRADGDTPTEGGFRFREVHEIFELICAAHPGVRLIDGLSLMPHVCEMMQDAYLHPNEIGFMHYGERLSRAIAGLGVDLFAVR